MDFSGLVFGICDAGAGTFCPESEPEPEPSNVLLGAGAGAEILSRSRSRQKIHGSASLLRSYKP